MTSLKFYVVSDSTGETAERIVRAALVQYPTYENAEIKRFPFVSQVDHLQEILSDALSEQAILVTTLVGEQLNQLVCDFVSEHQLKHLDYLSPMLKMITEQTGQPPVLEIGNLHHLDKNYFDRISAIEFAVKYDDGKSVKAFGESDIVLLGVSRTSKTPLSIYLANKSYKVSNLPLMPEVGLPEEIMKVPSNKLFGLIASPRYIMHMRSKRIKMMGLSSGTSYDDLERIKQELRYAKDVFSMVNAQIINIEDYSIEEIAQIIEESLKK